ncbi:MAG: IMP cyclohydrolase [Spirochaeta sp.]|jgi:phosphoribosylaminoimidazolecarboxamide formyltransferase/IMP cyclohydrolase|nr:IMP cyclohydrolase [Spirochaeta sp.]
MSSIYRTVLPDSFPNDLRITFGSGTDEQTIVYEKVTWVVNDEEKGLRYGENPDQEAALYRPVNGNLVLGEVRHVSPEHPLVSEADLLQSGKHPGKINLTDADAALNILRYFTETPACVIVKHNNPSGVALGSSLSEAYHRALMADRIAAFGGAIGLNREVDRETAERIVAYYAELVVAPEYSAGALEVFRGKKNLRLLRIANMAHLNTYVGSRYIDFKSLVDGGIIAQWSYQPRDLPDDILVPAASERDGVETRVIRKPTVAEQIDMRFGWFVESGVTSNSVIYVKDQCTVAIGTGEQDRVGVARIARDKAYWKLADRLAFEETGTGIEELTDPADRARFEARSAELHGGLSGSTMISDAFFPFPDGAEVGLSEGVTAILQPGGAIRDAAVIESVNRYGATMCFTGQRSFRH